MVPFRATARVQLHAGFTFDDARAQVDYYAALGVSHLYLSPITRAVDGSTHGYDVIDPTVVSPALGGEPALLRLAAQARAHGMGLIVDIVPNHVAAHLSNPYWADVLLRGQDSRYAAWFDIDWQAPGRHGKLWLPVLDRPLATALAEGQLQVERDAAGDAWLALAGSRYPLATQALPDAGPEPSTQAMSALLAAQAYRLAWWRSGDARVNYRRFFTVTALAALQMERTEVFDAVHALPLRLAAEGVIDGVRVDHVDGLRDPAAYLRRLRGALDVAGAGRQLPAGTLGLWVEKILGPDERLPADWPCDGSTGYDFMDEAGAVLHDIGGGRVLDQHWRQLTADPRSVEQVERQARAEVLDNGLRAEFDALVALAARVAEEEGGAAADFGSALLATAIARLLAYFPVYRSYLTDSAAGPADEAVWAQAATAARAGADPAVAGVITHVLGWMLQAPSAGAPSGLLRLRQQVQLLSAPLNAKAVEDCSFYRYAAQLSRNEVGTHPARRGLLPKDFHARAAERGRAHPRALLATATHDHKRGEDARMRLAVLSHWPMWWRTITRRLDRLALPLGGSSLHPGDRQMLWQTLVAAWPAHGRQVPDDLLPRLLGWQRKALREGGLRSSWRDPDAAYEAAAGEVLRSVCESSAGQALRQVLHAAVVRVAPAGARLSLAQTALRLTVPGVADLYQGTEGWDLSLVDPDNRRPVDYAARRRLLDDARPWPQLLIDWHDGAVKARLLHALLQVRRRWPVLFAHGDYRPLRTTAPDRVLALCREHGQQRVVLVVAIDTTAGPAPRATAALPARFWGAARVEIPVARYRNVLTGLPVDIQNAFTPLRALSADSPVTVLIHP
ncbi:malto-oligosyltrehalose synthase [Stenotrophomonas nematodicola]|uniref:Malto-oligosyltrehalose synthase n=1 Tax=Stenotrophomonas nematodicola TaxID=2656746 RepID=A0ABW7D1N0_9GAMM